MSNSISDFVVKEGFFGEAVLIAEATANTPVRGGGRAVKYPLMTENVALVDVFVSNPRKASDAKVMDKIILGRIMGVPRIQDVTENGRVTNSFVVTTFYADSADSAGLLDLKNFKKSENQIAKIGTGNGDVSDIMDFDKTFGELLLINSVPEYFRNPVTNQLTDEITNYAVTVRSTKNNEIYSIDVLNLDSKVKDLPPFTKLKFDTPEARLFRDNSQAENIRVSISMSAQDLLEVKEAVKPNTPQTPPASQGQEPNKSKNN
ncbi:hypothetical protein [Lactococcus allomyrinae]|uniref:Uncharacterized protein n=1 Tax=Lactococcus allomyrinae TaxID=2419773 RepID=A0A387BBU8_9LACT|nr:hypothetical protein [Lactococcus allomyrinae]AYG01325.1 hypothetical protein D7I46_09595 [Lactococcus allomyrinae]